MKSVVPGWGQHDTVELAKYAEGLDSTRVLNAASGWTDFPVSLQKRYTASKSDHIRNHQ